ncbi:Uncharacterized protein Adt_39500 [Abeliophyllum distichum]|uniref:Uncharacterized protein n=1 Tax=Abeliophyllum distichum TaxID=126358 RepID=A0ABD1Q584_9LAMI
MEYQEIYEDNMLVGDFLTPQIIQSQYEIEEDNMLVVDFIAMHLANTTRYNATFDIDEEVDTIMVAKIDYLAHKIESMSHSVYAMQTKKSTFEIDEDNMLFGDILAMQHANIARYEVTSEIDDDNMLFGDFLTMQHTNIVSYEATSEIDEDNMLVEKFIADHPNFSWNDNYNNIIPQGPQFQQPEKKTSLEDILSKFIEKIDQFMGQTEINLQNQGASIKNLEMQMGQMTVAISGSVPDTLSRNTEMNPKENVTAITTRSEVQLPEIYVKRSVANKEKVPSTDEERVEQTEQTTDIKESSGTPQVKTIVPIKLYEPPVSLSQRLQKHKLDKKFSNSHLSSKIDFVIKVDEEVEIFVVVFEQDATLKSYFYEAYKFKFLKINKKWCKINR